MASPSTRKPMFDPRSVYVTFVVDKVALRQVSLTVLHFSLVQVIPPLLHTDLYLHAAVNGRTNGRNTGTLKKSTVLSEIMEQWIGTYFHFVFKGSREHDFTMANNINTQNLDLYQSPT